MTKESGSGALERRRGLWLWLGGRGCRDGFRSLPLQKGITPVSQLVWKVQSWFQTWYVPSVSAPGQSDLVSA